MRERERADGRAGGRDEGREATLMMEVTVRGEYRFSSLVKLKKKEKIYALFYFAGKRIFVL